jgi:hypothetical protein
MPNPGFLRYSVAFVNGLGVVYLLVTGMGMTEEETAAVSQGVDASYVAIVGLYNALASLYSKMVPSA